MNSTKRLSLTGPLSNLLTRLRRCPDSEGEQAILRVVLISSIFLYLWNAKAFHSANGGIAEPFNLGFTIGVVIVSWVLVGWVVSVPLAVVSRRVSATFVDVLATVYGMHATAESGAPLYAVLMWIILGTGVRFGVRYLYLAAFLGAGGFFVMLRSTPYWIEFSTLGWGLLIGLVGIPTYGGLLLRRLEESKKKAEEANAAKGRFLASMSHEVRTPLNGVIGMSDLLLQSPLTPRQQEQISAIRGSGRTLLAIVDEVLEFSKLEAGKTNIQTGPVRLKDLTDQVVAQFLPESDKKGVKIRTQFGGDMPEWVLIDGLHVRQALTNLVSNAVKFTENGHIEVWVNFWVSDNNSGTLRFEVLDTGIGIPFELQHRVFDAFSQVDDSITRRYGGSGLGTAIAKQLVEQLGGEIGFQSKVGEGSRFWFSVPAERSTLLGEDEFATQNESSILIVAGGLGRGRFLGDVLEQNGFNVEFSSNSSDLVARQIVATMTNEPFRAIVIDFETLDWPIDELVEALNESGLNEGTTLVGIAQRALDLHKSSSRIVWLLEPFEEGQLILAVNRPSDPQRGRLEGRRILIADDQRTNRLVLRDFFSTQKCEVEFATDGEQALNMLLTRNYDLAVIDLHMPAMDGLGVISSYRFGCIDSSPIPTIVVTADLTEAVRSDCDDAEVAAFFEKPLDLNELSRTVEYLLPDNAAPDVAVLDDPFFSEEVIDSLSRNLSSERALERIVDVTIADIDALMRELTLSLDGADNVATRDILHSMKGTAVSVGAIRMRRSVERLAAATFSDDKSVTENYARELASVWQETRHRFRSSPIFDRG